MPLNLPQWRLILVIILSCVAINLVLYTSAAFSAERNEQRDSGVLLDSSHEALVNDNTNDRIVVAGKARSSRGRIRIKSKVSRVKNKKKKGNWSSSGNKTAIVGGGNLGEHSEGEEDHSVKRLVDRDAGKPRRLFRSSRAKSGLHDLNESESKPVSTKRNASTAPGKASEDFNIDNALRLFKGCVGEEEDVISLDCFNDGYEELSKLFRPLGAILSFVTSEIQEKIGILRDYRHHPVHGPNFRTVQSMVRYEMDHKLTIQTDKPSGSRTYLRLHWALQYITALITKIKDMDETSNFADEAKEAYDNTLGKHHPWYIRKGVHLATYSLPEKRELLVKLNMKDTSEEVAKVQALIDQLGVIYDISQKLFTQNRLLDLP